MTLLPLVLPDGFFPKVSVGDKLTKGKVIAEKKGNLGNGVVYLTKDYGIVKEDIPKSLKKNLGDFVEVGEAVAVKKGTMGLGTKKVLSGFSGTVVRIDEELGEIHIKTGTEEKVEELFSPVDGIVEICNNEKIVIKTSVSGIIAEDVLGQEARGELAYVKQITQEALSSQISEKILLVKTIDKISVFKALGLDVAGIIIQEFEDTDFIDLANKKIGCPIAVVSEENFNKLTKHIGENIYLNGKDKSLVLYE